MPHWYWEKKELRSTPSQQQLKMSHEQEVSQRREGVRFILDLGKNLNLSHITMATAAVYFHRFYMFHDLGSFPKLVVATTCLFLAGKCEETPKKCRDLIRVVRSLTSDEQFASFGADSREEVMVTERVLLQTIKFDLQVEHPYASLIQYAKCLKGDKATLERMVQMSWTFVNDSLCTMLCLQWEPEIIAIALMYLAGKLLRFDVMDWTGRRSTHRNWWDQYVDDLDVSVLDDICHQVLDLYTSNKEGELSKKTSSNAPGFAKSSGLDNASKRSSASTNSSSAAVAKTSSAPATPPPAASSTVRLSRSRSSSRVPKTPPDPPPPPPTQPERLGQKRSAPAPPPLPPTEPPPPASKRPPSTPQPPPPPLPSVTAAPLAPPVVPPFVPTVAPPPSGTAPVPPSGIMPYVSATPPPPVPSTAPQGLYQQPPPPLLPPTFSYPPRHLGPPPTLPPHATQHRTPPPPPPHFGKRHPGY